MRAPFLPSTVLLGLLLSGCTSADVRQPLLERAGVAEVNGAALFYQFGGTGHPLVLIHGGNLDHRMWDAQVAEFARRHRVIRYDVRGFGRSGSWERPHTAHDDLRALLDHLGVRRAHVVGLSLGGRIALDFALAYPSRVASLVLASPGLSGFEWAADSGEWLAPIREAVTAGDSLRAAERWLASPFMAPAMRDPSLAAQLRRMARENAHVWVRRSAEQPLTPPAIGRLEEVRVPVLLVLGTGDFPEIHRVVDVLEGGVAQAVRVEFEGAGHMVNMERPIAFNKVVLRFLEGQQSGDPVR